VDDKEIVTKWEMIKLFSLLFIDLNTSYIIWGEQKEDELSLKIKMSLISFLISSLNISV
jgi:hypothetical protein